MKESVIEIIKALKKKDEIQFKQLLQTHGFDINDPIDAQGNRLAHFFAKEENLQALDILIRNGAFFHKMLNNFNHSPFSVAILSKEVLTSVGKEVKKEQILKRIFNKNSLEELLALYIYEANYISSRKMFNLTESLRLAIENKSTNTIHFLAEILRFNSDPTAENMKDMLKLSLICGEAKIFGSFFLPDVRKHPLHTNLDTQLFDIIKYCPSERVPAFLKIIREANNISSINLDNSSLLHGLAIANYKVNEINNLKIVYQFLSTKINFDINLKNENGRTPLHLATLTRNQPLISALLEIGINNTLRDKYDKKAEDLLDLSNDERINFLMEEKDLLSSPLFYKLITSIQENVPPLAPTSSALASASAEVNESEEDIEIFESIKDKFKSYKINAICKKINQIILPLTQVSKKGWLPRIKLSKIPAKLQYNILKFMVDPSHTDYTDISTIVEKPDCPAYLEEAWKKARYERAIY